jgi:hypothetical protein
VLEKVDPRGPAGGLSPASDQGQLGGFAATAVAVAAAEYDGKLYGSDPDAFSGLWIYYYQRMIEGSADQDTGARLTS